MPKNKEKLLARYYYVDQQKTARESAELAGVTQATMSKWVHDSGWNPLRQARALSRDASIENIQSLMNIFAAERIAASQEVEKATIEGDAERVKILRQQIGAIDSSAARWDKRMKNAQGKNKVSLEVYLMIMSKIFNALREYDPKIHLQTVEFQEAHVEKVSDNEDMLCV